MKLVIEKKFYAVLDIDKERARINKSFADDLVTRNKLLKLMDAIEKGDWKEARKQLEGKWWQGYDRKVHCNRIEFIGMPFHAPDLPIGFSCDVDYTDLIYSFTEFPANYRIVSTQRHWKSKEDGNSSPTKHARCCACATLKTSGFPCLRKG